MDGNRDDALRCEAIGKEAMRVQDFSKALKFFQKSLRLYPSDNVSTMMQQAQAGLEGKGGAGEEDNGVRKRGPKDGRSGNGTSGMASASASASQPAVSAEHLELVRRVRRSSSYYEILEVSRTCSDEDVRKAYRKLSLKVHPDKNKAPGAEEAFKAVSKAFQCLSDTDLRSNYDQFGHEDPQAMAQQRQRNAHAQRQRHRGLDDDFDPNDIFNAFFGGNGVMNDHFNGRMFRAQFGGAQQPRNPSGGGPRGGGGNNNVGVLPLLQLLPLLAIFLYALLPAAEPVYKLERMEGYQVERTTSGWNIPYFVRPGEFDGKYPVGTRDRRRLEQAVEQEYRETAETRCYHERVQQAQLYRWGQAQKARDLAMPFCEELRRLQRAW